MAVDVTFASPPEHDPKPKGRVEPQSGDGFSGDARLSCISLLSPEKISVEASTDHIGAG